MSLGILYSYPLNLAMASGLGNGVTCAPWAEVLTSLLSTPLFSGASEGHLFQMGGSNMGEPLLAWVPERLRGAERWPTQLTHTLPPPRPPPAVCERMGEHRSVSLPEGRLGKGPPLLPRTTGARLSCQLYRVPWPWQMWPLVPCQGTLAEPSSRGWHGAASLLHQAFLDLAEPLGTWAQLGSLL